MIRSTIRVSRIKNFTACKMAQHSAAPSSFLIPTWPVDSKGYALILSLLTNEMQLPIPLVKKIVFQLYRQSVVFSAAGVIINTPSNKGVMCMEIKLGQSIHDLRKASGLTQEQLAEALGVTTGAVHKWESGKATPELPMLVDIAEFFETSVDAMLNYGWEKLSMGQAVEKLRSFQIQRQLDEGIRYAEKALKKYPNSFDITLASADAYTMAMASTDSHFKEMRNATQYALRAVELYQRAVSLFSQNEDQQISLVTLQNRIADCYYFMNRADDAIELLKKNNVEGLNDSMIGFLLSNEPSREDEALRHLSDSLYGGQAMLFRTCIGYANAYFSLGKYREVEELILWLLDMGKGLRQKDVIGYLDKADVWLYCILAAASLRQGNDQSAFRWLRKAKETALRFDAAPQYKTSVGLKFYHSNDNAMSYDSMGQTAVSSIANFLKEDKLGKELSPIWKKVCAEE